MAVSAKRCAAGKEKQAIEGVRNVVAVGSGKGGVGKSTVTVNLAIALAQSGAAVGILDADIYGPNIPLMMGITGRPCAINERIQTLGNYGVRLMSMGFLLDEDDTPVIWRGPMLHSVIQQFIRQVDWGELDYLLIDLPPGTGDVQLSLTTTVPLTGAVVVSTPQDVALQDARKAIQMFRQVDVTVLGIVENMSYFKCPNCGEISHVFSHGGGAETAERYNAPFLGEVPLTAALREGGDAGKPVVAMIPDSPVTEAFRQIASRTAAQVNIVNTAKRNPTVIHSTPPKPLITIQASENPKIKTCD
jgi:ATP-binding protein involved in chromosome partitioning